MPSILITRPAAMSETLAGTLKQIGYQTVCEPLLTIVPVRTPNPATGAIDVVMITSANALLALKDRQSDIAGFLDLPCFCVGPRTAAAAQEFGFRHIHAATSDGIELAGLLTRSLAKKAAIILHIAGRDVNGAARQELEMQGHLVTEWPVYEAVAASALTPFTRDLLAGNRLDAVLIFSPRTARVLSELIAFSALEACCARMSAICLSEAVADGVRSHGWLRLIAVANPTEDAVIACLQETCPV